MPTTDHNKKTKGKDRWVQSGSASNALRKKEVKGYDHSLISFRECGIGLCGPLTSRQREEDTLTDRLKYQPRS